MQNADENSKNITNFRAHKGQVATRGGSWLSSPAATSLAVPTNKNYVTGLRLASTLP